MDLYNLKAYKVLEERFIKEIDSNAFLLEHNKTKAKVVVMANEDKNKTFAISFRTPPTNDTGVPHIIEHSVLCGSKKFPSKEPFVELMKASLNTFLNAMTYPDKTMYPVSSCNDKDFQNLMDVYLDAVFYPNMHTNEKIFKQEGWHYELDDKDGELIYNGVVYNEMKGAFSSADQVLMREILHVMYKDNCYTYESGGNPEFIPTLSYQEFLDFHKKYYHPSNSYIYLYGDCDFEEKLNWIDEEYLSKFEEKKIDSHINEQLDFEKTIKHYVEYPVGADETLEGKTYISRNYLMGNSKDTLLWMTLTILSYVLFDAPGAKVKQALLDANIGKEISSSYDAGLIQPLFTIYASGTDKDREDEFNRIIEETLKQCVIDGIDKKSLKAAINVFEFKYREADFGSEPKGLIYGLNMMDTWLYDQSPFLRLETDKVFDKLKEYVDTNYFEEIVSKYFLDNNNLGIVVVSPSNTLGKQKDEETKKKLKEYKESLSEDEVQRIILETKELKEYQAAPSKKEDLDKIPYLTREDLKTELNKISNLVVYENGVKILHHNHFTNGIGYLRVMFNTKDLDEEYLPYLGILASVLGKVNTKKYTYSEINTEKNLNTGGIGFDTYLVNNNYEYKLYLTCDSSVLYEKIDFAYDMIGEIINNSIFDDKKRMREIIFELKNRKESTIVSRGHIYSYNKALSYIDKGSYASDLLSGIRFYKTLEKITNDFDNEFEKMVSYLQTLVKYIFQKENMMISYTSNMEGFERMRKEVKEFSENLQTEKVDLKTLEYSISLLNEGIKTSSNVQYVSRAGNFVKHGFKYNGAIVVLNNILSTEYLWVKGRVLGGAYGCMCTFRRNGNVAFLSYRDPNLRETNKIYEEVLDFIKTFDATEEEMTKYIIGAVGSVVIPRTPRMEGAFDLTSYLNNVTDEDYARELEEIIKCTAEDIRSLYDLVKSVIDDKALCVIGNENKIEEQKDLFNNIFSLIN